jgi:predicted aspartyl protease
MQLHVNINGACLLALLDSGSTQNFINLEAAAHVGL